MKVTAEISFRLESFVRTISRGMPGFTSAALMYSVPRSMPSTAETANTWAEKKNIAPSSMDNGDNVGRAMVGDLVWVSVGNCSVECAWNRWC